MECVYFDTSPALKAVSFPAFRTKLDLYFHLCPVCRVSRLVECQSWSEATFFFLLATHLFALRQWRPNWRGNDESLLANALENRTTSHHLSSLKEFTFGSFGRWEIYVARLKVISCYIYFQLLWTFSPCAVLWFNFRCDEAWLQCTSIVGVSWSFPCLPYEQSENDRVEEMSVRVRAVINSELLSVAIARQKKRNKKKKCT